MHVELTQQGSLHIEAAIAQTYFPHNGLVALLRGPELWLLPIRGPAAGGLLLKQRNARGDRSVLIWEVLPPNTAPGTRSAFWDERNGALRVALIENVEFYEQS